jgi:hypothetical protein
MLKLAASVLALIAAVAAVLWISRSLNDSPEEQAYGYFLRDVATVEAMGLQVYWLGQELAVDDVSFRGPYGAKFRGEVSGTRIGMTYVALERGNAGLHLTVYSADAWELVEDRMMHPRSLGTSHTSVSILGKTADVFAAPGGARPLNALWLVLDLDDVVVVAETNSVIAPAIEGAVELNPIIKNPDLLIQVMEELRPYPQ